MPKLKISTIEKRILDIQAKQLEYHRDLLNDMEDKVAQLAVSIPQQRAKIAQLEKELSDANHL